MKKLIFITLVTIVSFFSFLPISFGIDCGYSTGSSLDVNLKNCLGNTNLVQGPNGNNLKINDGFRSYITGWTNNIALYLGILAVFGIALGAFMLVSSSGQEDRITKAKTVIKWSILGFIAVITAALIINLIVRIMYSDRLTGVGGQNQGGTNPTGQTQSTNPVNNGP